MNHNILNKIILASSLMGLWIAGFSQSQWEVLTDQDAYLETRKQLVEQDLQAAYGMSIELTEAEKQLNQTLQRIQRNKLDAYQAGHFFPPARYFYGSQDHMEADELFHILRRMPKGGIHHLHSIAITDVDWIIEEAIEQDHCYVYWGKSTDQYLKGQLQFFRPGTEPSGFVKTKDLNKGVPDFRHQMKELLTLSATTDGDSVDIWKEFEHYFGCVYQFVYYQPVYKKYYEQGYRSLLEDGIQHIEVRMNMLPLYSLDQPDGYYPVDSSIVYQREVLESLRKEYPNFTLKLIYTNLRFFSNEVIASDLIQAYQLSNRFPELVSGYDLVGEEDAGRPTLDYLDVWQQIDSLNKVYKTEMPLYFHDGESNWLSNDNLFDAVLLQSDRIGHAFNLFRYPALWGLVKANDICLEVCPLSNQILGYVRDLRNHPASLYMKLGLPVSISSDDPATFAYEGVSPDYWAIFYAWELDLHQLKQLCQNGITYAALGEAEKAKAIAAWEKSWNEFVDWANEELAGK